MTQRHSQGRSTKKHAKQSPRADGLPLSTRNKLARFGGYIREQRALANLTTRAIHSRIVADVPHVTYSELARLFSPKHLDRDAYKFDALTLDAILRSTGSSSLEMWEAFDGRGVNTTTRLERAMLADYRSLTPGSRALVNEHARMLREQEERRTA